MKTKSFPSPFLCLHSFAQYSPASLPGVIGTAPLAANIHPRWFSRHVGMRIGRRVMPSASSRRRLRNAFP